MKPLIALSSLAMGGAAMGGVLYLQTQPLALTSLKGQDLSEASSIGDVRPLYVAPAELRVSQGLALRSEGKRAKRPRQAAPIPAPSPVHTACSEWRTLGPKAVNVDGTPGDHRVRALCD